MPFTTACMCFTAIHDLVSQSFSEAQTLYFSHVLDLEMQCRMSNVKSNTICMLRAARSLGVLWELAQGEVLSLETLTGEFQLLSMRVFELWYFKGMSLGQR